MSPEGWREGRTRQAGCAVRTAAANRRAPGLDLAAVADPAPNAVDVLPMLPSELGAALGLRSPASEVYHLQNSERSGALGRDGRNGNTCRLPR